MLKKEKNLTGNDRFSGFCVDMLEYVSRMAGFNYIIEMSGGGVYGMIDTETGEWNGLVRELKDKVSRIEGECGVVKRRLSKEQVRNKNVYTGN
ncbi:Glutamate receptor ionotropic, kainate 2 [Portunus trituberculatus]|uniref:Glutamate receptor ionotropic, kainate 2 n=1 Tax=Portunus trituberculatus TaxID=210409 RepID=A0A5B7GM94_PORTR|nr:Glutamate receptor ionotropic, kainate 2 [Portunus trituberculatus]